MGYTISKIAELLDVSSTLANSEYPIENISIDSRRIIDTAATLFFAISGPRNDGHLFIQELIDQGIKCFVVNHIPASINDDSINFLVVKDTE